MLKFIAHHTSGQGKALSVIRGENLTSCVLHSVCVCVCVYVCVRDGGGIGVLNVFKKFLPFLTLAALAKGFLLSGPLLGLNPQPQGGKQRVVPEYA